MARWNQRSKNPEGNVGLHSKDILKHIKDFGLEGFVSALRKEEKREFYEVFEQFTLDKEFKDLRFGELFYADGYKAYKVKPFKELNSLESKNAVAFIWEMLFKDRIIKLYPNEFDSLPDQLKSMIKYDETYHNRKRMAVRGNYEHST